jgi:hypothetical protein
MPMMTYEKKKQRRRERKYNEFEQDNNMNITIISIKTILLMETTGPQQLNNI